MKGVDNLTEWKWIEIPHPKRKYRRPLVNDSLLTLRGYEGEVRQVIMKVKGHEKATFMKRGPQDCHRDRSALK